MTEEQSARLSKWRSRLPAILFLCLASYLYFRTTVFRAPTHLNVSALNLQFLGGDPVATSRTQNKAVILNFWAPWCGPCIVEMPALQRLQAAHTNDLLIVGIVNDPDTYAEAAVFAATHGITYPILRKSNAMTTTIGAINTIPVTLFVDRTGNVVHSAVGELSEARMQQYAVDILSN